MKWKTESPKPGAEREVRRFAWKPTKLNTGYTVWLEQYAVVQRLDDEGVWRDGWKTHLVVYC